MALPIPAVLPQGSIYEAVAFFDQPLPGIGTLAWFTLPRINPDGKLAFFAYTQFEQGRIIAGKPGDFRLVAASGGAEQGGGMEFSSLGDPSIATNGHVAFSASKYEGEVWSEGIWAETDAGLSLVQAGDGGYFGPVAFRSGSRLAVKISSRGGELEEPGALLFGPPRAMTPVLEEGDAAPGFGSGATVYQVFGYEGSSFFDGPGADVDLNEEDEMAVKVRVAPSPSFTPPPVDVIYVGKSGALNVAAREGTQAPGIANATLGQLSPAPSIASNGFIAFSAEVNDYEQSLFQAVFAGPRGGLAPIIRSGDPVPAAPEGVVFRSFDKAVINETGDVVFGATIEYPNETTRAGIWIKRLSGPPVLIAVSGITLDSPGGPVELSSVDFAGPGSFNDLHQLAFQVGTEEGSGIYIADTRPGIPWLRLTQPRNRREQVTQDRVTRIAGRALDATGIAKVEYTVTPLGQAKGSKKKRARAPRGPRLAKGDRNWSFNVPLAMGRNRISIVATDKLGNVSEPIEFTMIRWEPGAGIARGKRR